MIRAIHRKVWQRLPRSFRRALLFRASTYLAPRPDPTPDARGPIVVAGVLRSASGLGQSARLCYDALARAGIPVAGIDLSRRLMAEPDLADLSFVDGGSLTGPGTLIVHVNSPLLPLAIAAIGREVLAGKRVVGYWAWELARTPAEWRVGVPFVHEIWVPSRFVAAAIASAANGVPVRIIPHPISAPRLDAPRRDASRPFTVLVVFNMASSLARKNPLAAIAAFRRAFGDTAQARMIIKVMSAESYPAGMNALRDAIRGASNIALDSRTLSRPEMRDLYLAADVLVSLHRSEGFGLCLVEAMLHGRPVVATDWSGSTDFLTADNGMPVAWKPRAAHDPQGEYEHPDLSWADARCR
jgi:glycosyltransferase involved in cell wall biosynthesis